MIVAIESHVAKWLLDNCVDTNATVLQNALMFMDHASNVYKDKVALYETRGDMERLPSDAANPNAFSDTFTRLCKEYNNDNPNWQAAGGDIRSGRFDYLPAKAERLLLAVKPRVGIMVPRLDQTTDTS